MFRIYISVSEECDERPLRLRMQERSYGDWKLRFKFYEVQIYIRKSSRIRQLQGRLRVVNLERYELGFSNAS